MKSLWNHFSQLLNVAVLKIWKDQKHITKLFVSENDNWKEGYMYMYIVHVFTKADLNIFTY